MSKRLQVVLGDREYREIRRAANREGLTLSEWVRRSLESARASQPASNAAKKLAVVRSATEHGFPTANIDRMLEEIERGYASAP